MEKSNGNMLIFKEKSDTGSLCPSVMMKKGQEIAGNGAGEGVQPFRFLRASGLLPMTMHIEK